MSRSFQLGSELRSCPQVWGSYVERLKGLHKPRYLASFTSEASELRLAISKQLRFWANDFSVQVLTPNGRHLFTI